MSERPTHSAAKMWRPGGVSAFFILGLAAWGTWASGWGWDLLAQTAISDDDLAKIARCEAVAPETIRKVIAQRAPVTCDVAWWVSSAPADGSAVWDRWLTSTMSDSEPTTGLRAALVLLAMGRPLPEELDRALASATGPARAMADEVLVLMPGAPPPWLDPALVDRRVALRASLRGDPTLLTGPAVRRAAWGMTDLGPMLRDVVRNRALQAGPEASGPRLLGGLHERRDLVQVRSALGAPCVDEDFTGCLTAAASLLDEKTEPAPSLGPVGRAWLEAAWGEDHAMAEDAGRWLGAWGRWIAAREDKAGAVARLARGGGGVDLPLPGGLAARATGQPTPWLAAVAVVAAIEATGATPTFGVSDGQVIVGTRQEAVALDACGAVRPYSSTMEPLEPLTLLLAAAVEREASLRAIPHEGADFWARVARRWGGASDPTCRGDWCGVAAGLVDMIAAGPTNPPSLRCLGEDNGG